MAQVSQLPHGMVYNREPIWKDETMKNNVFETPLQQVMYLDKYARWNHTLNRREDWDETVVRVMDFLLAKIRSHFNEDVPKEVTEAFFEFSRAFYSLEVLPSMRILQMAGEPLERCNVGAYNCAFLPIDSPEALAELLYILMQGTGVGFSVEHSHVIKWPVVIPPQEDAKPITFKIADTTESWCDALKYGINTWLAGGDVEFDYSAIRPYGARLKTKGGKASGPAPLRHLLEFTKKTIQSRAGKYLRSIDLHDIACYCGQIVQVGGVRRAALISLSDITDENMREAKKGKFWNKHPQRMMANNSAVYTSHKDLIFHFFDEFQALQRSGTGERGIFNRGGFIPPARRSLKDIPFGMNPCGEIILRPRQFCNLSIAVCRASDTYSTLRKKVYLATFIGVVQSLLTDFKYLSSDWKKNCEEERLLGVDITGQYDNINIFMEGENLRDLRDHAVFTAEKFAKLFKINMPAAVTCVKPSGNSAQLLNCSSGVHPRYAPYYIRRIRIGAGTTMAKFLISSGVPYNPETGSDPEHPRVLVFDFPIASPGHGPTREDVGLLEQLEYWLNIKKHYTEHNPSCTIYVKPDEWTTLYKWLCDHFDHVTGLSFLPYDGGHYPLMPYEEISKEKYAELMSKFPKLDFEEFYRMDKKDETEFQKEFACTGDKCEF